ncbi:MAG: glycoside hydrolase family 43 protein [Deltaproteobacteria bacterium]|nr:glycoside hydrolase family 43 protein [Deltaproteobacteria bacterium]
MSQPLPSSTPCAGTRALLLVFSLTACSFPLGCDGDGSEPYTALDDRTHNPVIETVELADPHVIRHRGRYYLYPTDGNGPDAYLGYDVYTSDDLVHWTQGPRVFTHPGPNVWAPDVFEDPDSGRFFLYYSLADGHIGVAIADRPEGPFEDQGLLTDQGIDAFLFRDDDGRLYLYYSQFVLSALQGSLWVQPMKSPTETDGAPTRILDAQGWERFLGFIGIIEAPWMLKRDDVYYLMYSGNATTGLDYAVGYATSTSPLGPFTRYEGNPILRRDDDVLSPGHHAVVDTPDGGLAIVYHQKTTREFKWLSFGDRVVCADRMGFDDAGNLWTAPTPLRTAPP